MRYILLFLLSFNAYATVQNLNVRFSDGGSASGFVEFPDIIPPNWKLVGWFTPLDWDIKVSGGQFAPFEYVPANSHSDVSGPPDYWGNVWFQAQGIPRGLSLTRPLDRGDTLLVNTLTNGGVNRGSPLSSEVIIDARGRLERTVESGCLSDARQCAPVRCLEGTDATPCPFESVALPLNAVTHAPEPSTALMLLAVGMLAAFGMRMNLWRA